ncbi:hypothetical protein TSUD_402780 [Trifolium subterraneum]|uniref:CCHC-type domain-containing protein n=1 Tax=Trifolium subterraneum TaxID=3900 RepID=A0A2Z6PBY1_TRISU|nr:hypothetical protein TSUD_402780 [Trifolium subterraneum]
MLERSFGNYARMLVDVNLAQELRHGVLVERKVTLKLLSTELTCVFEVCLRNHHCATVITVRDKSSTTLVDFLPGLVSPRVEYTCSKCVFNATMSETFNSWIIGPRQKPIVTMLEEIKGQMMSRWTTNRTKFDNLSDGEILPNIKEKLAKERNSCRFWFCRLAGEKIYDVVSTRNVDVITEKYIVDLNKMEYRKEDHTTTIPTIYRKEKYQDVYSSIIYPTSGQNTWDRTNNVDILPPPLRRAPGRPKRSRNKNADENRSETGNCSIKGMTGKCTKCGQSGHNKTTCKGPTPTGQTSSSAAQTSNAPTPTQTTSSVAAQTSNTPTPTQTTPSVAAQTSSQPPATTKKKQAKNSKVGPSKPTSSSANTQPIPPKPTTSSSQPLATKRKASATSSSQPSSGSRSKLPTRRANA